MTDIDKMMLEHKIKLQQLTIDGLLDLLKTVADAIAADFPKASKAVLSIVEQRRAENV